MSKGKHLIFFVAVLTVFLCEANPIEPGMPEVCRGKLMCQTRSDHYPQDKIEALLSASENFYDQPTIIGDRDGGDDEISDCDTHRSIDPIYEIIDENGKLRYVVQSQKKFKQIILIEECLEKKPKAINFPEVIIEQYKLTCEPKYIDYKFIVLSEDETTLETAKMKGGVPVCCSCRRPEN